MTLPRGWLRRFLAECFARGATGPRERLRTRAHARRIVSASLDHRGLGFGAPLLRREQKISKDAGELILLMKWLAALADHVDLVGRVLDEEGVSRAEAIDRRVRAFASALALVYGSDEDARVLATFAIPAKVERALTNLERELTKRRYLQGNPLLGLTLFPAFSAMDARAAALAAVEVYGAAPADRAATRVQAALAHERVATLSAIAALSEWRELIDADLVRSASIWQVKSLGLSRAETSKLVEQTKSPADLARFLTLVPEGATERIVRAVALAAWIDGRQSPEERAFYKSLCDALGVGRAVRKRVEKRARTFLRSNLASFEPLALAAGFGAASPPIAVRVARLVFDNMDSLWNEIRETGDLAYLLTKRASGHTLSEGESRRMREQLVDVAKTVPSLAVFALPGGFVLLPVVLKLLPFDLRPSSFRRREESFHAFALGDDDVATEDDLLPRTR